jgi:hypothetical protein
MIKKGGTAAAYLVAASLLISAAWGDQQGSTKARVPPKTIDMNAVVCTRLSLIEVQAETKACNCHRLPIDSAIVQAIRETDAFIIRNSPSPITQESLD